MARWPLVLLLALVPLAAVPLVGQGALSVSVVVLLVGLGLAAAARGAGRWRYGILGLALLLALAGGAIGVSSAVSALQTVGGLPEYNQRIGFGWAALAFAVLATAGPLLAAARPGVAIALVVASGLLGVAAISLFYINTYYLCALPFWLIAATVGLFARPVRPNRHPDREDIT